MDITYIPMARGFVYLTAVMDWASRRVLSWRLSDHARQRLLHRGRGGGDRALRLPGRSSTRTRARNSPAPPSPACCSITGSRSAWMAGLLAGQHLRRAALAHDQVRRGLSARLRHRVRGDRGDRSVSHPLQHPPAALQPRGSHTRRSLLHAAAHSEERRNPARQSSYLTLKGCTEKRSHFTVPGLRGSASMWRLRK